jgi:hypothetical protein
MFHPLFSPTVFRAVAIVAKTIGAPPQPHIVRYILR